MITDAPPAQLAQLESADVGVVHRLDDAVTSYDHPRLSTCYAHLCDTRPVFGLVQDARAGAIDGDLGRARSAALGEAVERYSAVHVPASRLLEARAEELDSRPHAAPDWLDRRAVHPSVPWVPGHRLHADRPAEPAWVAASRAYLAEPAELDLVAMPTSTGLACHSDPWQALYSGLLEVIERDAMMVGWLTQAPTTPLRTALRWRLPSGASVRFDRSVERYELYRLDSPTGIPVVFGVAYGATGQPAVAVGAAASLDVVQACRKALIEAQQTFAWAVLLTTQGANAPTDPAEFESLEQHVVHYLDPANLSAFAFLHENQRPAQEVDLEAPSARRPAEQLCRHVLAALDQAGLASFVVDVTSPDIREAGLWVTRAVVPELYPLLLGRRAPDHPRVSPALAAVGQPHPFP